ncbi:Polysaccharide pyruvyl transferase [Loktanella fryxellensis]|uniref:Polysaccharide pyruvyl transferase n=1 Tax=Loktanella fryxellensis TaxID=245187 RepID=A0A1H8GYS9_9RHOB|nr:polysaccharide pyruvyl transferase family protein [Loktanella fryxellensis]SEN49291.1 Polysaccharide pyruvyl transferase [Loktanella fryxellensis]
MKQQDSKRIGILTLPFNGNYGGMIQSVALYRFLEQQGMEPIILRKKLWRPKWQRPILAFLRKIPGQNLFGVRERYMRQMAHELFLRQVMPSMTLPIYDTSGMSRIASQLDAVVVGSDQVWRGYLKNLDFLNYFLDFVPDGVKRISYAASFGLSDWAMPHLTADASKLLGRFDAMSVREHSAITICRETLERADAHCTLDPTLLLDAAAYERMMPVGDRSEHRTVLMYVLDKNGVMSEIEMRLRTDDGDLHTQVIENGETGKASAISLPEWLRAFRDAEHVLTDSFHGMVFSIIFRKNFYALGNRERGLDRFTSLLGQLGLEDRLVLDDAVPDNLSHIDYAPVEKRLAVLQQDSKDFLLRALQGSNEI